MKIHETSTPVVIVNCKLGALGIMRSLGSQNIPTYGVDADRRSPGMLSRYCKDRFLMGLNENNGAEFLDYLLRIGEGLGRPSILIPTSDETSVFVAEKAAELKKRFIFPLTSPDLMKALISKKEMYYLARKHNVPTAYTEFPESIADVKEYIRSAKLPVMVKGIFGNRLQERTGTKMVIAHTAEELIHYYKLLEDPEVPNVMLQEYIPGGDDQIYIFNGYFNSSSDCLAAFTGHKIRQFPVHVGCASLGICTWNEAVSRITTDFMKAIGYRGILDIGYRYDARDGLYKVLDINPRVGQAFRLFLAESGMDVVRALYMDLTGQRLYPVIPKEGRKWMIEDFDIVSTYHYFQEGSLSLGEWIGSFRRLEEGAWFSLNDPVPFTVMVAGLLKKAASYMGKKVRVAKNDTRSKPAKVKA